MKILSILSVLLLGAALTACESQQPSAIEQQKFVCRTLIDGFLKTQAISDYQLDDIETVNSERLTHLLYTYKAPQSHHLHQRVNLQFDCQKMAERKFQIKLRFPQNLLSEAAMVLAIELPKQSLKPLTTYAVAPRYSLLK